ncbi:hypothetical protein QTP70_004156 [Hemibagrus guttatus]|uniref:ribonuclease H n=1 Tax=Hemibagrus guttatus TaxID=175788 RepID=A0AAE0RHE3_9TELE|nr:hypothetical protein QTP70_004156 [Hemibagrus guttatus]
MYSKEEKCQPYAWIRLLIHSYQDQVEALQSQLCSTSTAAPPRDPPAARSEAPRLAMPEKYDGSADRCRGFLRHCEVFFAHQPGVYREEGTRCAFLLSLLMGKALDWDSQPIGGGYLTRQTELLDFQVGLFHREHLAFYVISSPANPVILGFLWLWQHDPQISWHTGELVCWSATCLKECLLEPVSRPCMASVVEDSASLASRHIPHVYEDFREMFNEERALACQAKAMEEYIEEALAVGQIRPSTSPAAAGFFFMGKKDRGLCPCIDYRGLNAITICYPYPLPLVPAALEQLRGAKFFTKVDLLSAYNRFRIREGDEWKTTFHATHGHYEYLVMPFGLTNAPVVFQSLINEVFQDILGKWVIAYIDDILVYSTSLEEHVRHVREVLSRLQRHHLFVKPEKCEFHQTTMTFLGYVIMRQGVKMDVTKVQVVTEWPSPTTVKELQQFLGFANFYRHFIRNYSSVAGPLTSLLKEKPRRLTWTDQAQAAFQQLKDCFTTAPILHHPDLPFVEEVDASSSVEANYDVGNRELLSIKAVLEEWQYWLEGARHLFLVLTDHRNLEYLRSAKRLNPRQASKPIQPDLILPVAAILVPVRWSLMEEIRRAHANMPPLLAALLPRSLCCFSSTGRHARRALSLGSAASFQRGCWSLYQLTRLGRIYYGDGRGVPVLKGV